MTLTIVLLAYLLGSISCAVITSRIWHLPDPRTYGSGNPGATNVLRSGKKAAATVTLLGDCAKGWVAVALVQHLADAQPVENVMALAAVGVVVGHIYPVFFRFHGGKGVATALGAIFGLNVYVAAGSLATWLIMAGFFRISSFAALVAALFAPFFTWLLYDASHPYFAAVSVISTLLVWRHRSNIRNLLSGKESRIGSSGGP